MLTVYAVSTLAASFMQVRRFFLGSVIFTGDRLPFYLRQGWLSLAMEVR
jgi:hypothetical protein